MFNYQNQKLYFKNSEWKTRIYKNSGLHSKQMQTGGARNRDVTLLQMIHNS